MFPLYLLVPKCKVNPGPHRVQTIGLGLAPQKGMGSELGGQAPTLNPQTHPLAAPNRAESSSLGILLPPHSSLSFSG